MTEGYQVRYSPQAVEDLKDIYAYISQELHQRDTAAAQVSRIRAEIRSLDFLPLRYHCVDWEPWQSMGMRKAAAGKFLIFLHPQYRKYDCYHYPHSLRRTGHCQSADRAYLTGLLRHTRKAAGAFPPPQTVKKV